MNLDMPWCEIAVCVLSIIICSIECTLHGLNHWIMFSVDSDICLIFERKGYYIKIGHHSSSFIIYVKLILTNAEKMQLLLAATPLLFNSDAAGGQYKIRQNIWKVAETLDHWYSFESTLPELCNAYQYSLHSSGRVLSNEYPWSRVSATNEYQ